MDSYVMHLKLERRWLQEQKLWAKPTFSDQLLLSYSTEGRLSFIINWTWISVLWNREPFSPDGKFIL